ncbi:hypothetical protein MPSEU_000460900 [Mayamaea pseudoterrestris]|nr:hypothetical protein MPSEU_000460900 [Mayamaea pseudoterrestris]
MSNEDSHQQHDSQQQPLSAPQNSQQHQLDAPVSAASACFRRLPNKRFVYEFNGQPVYEWTQTMDECTMYIRAPPAPVKLTMQPHHLTIRLKHASTTFIDEDFCHKINVDESTWTLEDNMIVIYLQKANKAVVWEGLLQGRPFLLEQQPNGSDENPQQQPEPIVLHTGAKLDVLQFQEVQKEIMLERWGEQYPGMNFDDAEFNGAVPDPRSFMGGVSHK